MVQLLKERKEELKRLARENERLTAEIETYAVVLQGFMEAQDTEHERNRAAAIRVSKEWNDEALPLHTEPQQSSAGPSLGKRARASSFQTEQQQMVRELRSHKTDDTKLWNQKVHVTLLVRVNVISFCI
jgi:hypothetical protein